MQREETFEGTNEAGKLSLTHKVAYSLPEVAKNPVTMMMNVHVIYFFNIFGARQPRQRWPCGRCGR